ncbi:hypothetical protein D3C73_993770 [compost metagenome]
MNQILSAFETEKQKVKFSIENHFQRMESPLHKRHQTPNHDVLLVVLQSLLAVVAQHF